MAWWTLIIYLLTLKWMDTQWHHIEYIQSITGNTANQQHQQNSNGEWKSRYFGIFWEAVTPFYSNILYCIQTDKKCSIYVERQLPIRDILRCSLRQLRILCWSNHLKMFCHNLRWRCANFNNMKYGYILLLRHLPRNLFTFWMMMIIKELANI